MPKIVCVSDSHTFENFTVPDGDILIHSGDISFTGTFVEMSKGMRWLGKFSHKFKIFVCGNHDWLGETDPLLMKELANENGITYLDDSGAEIMGFKVWGSPVQPEFNSWAFNRKRGAEIAKHWAKIPENTQILISHGPPMGILDEVDRGIVNGIDMGREHVGCEELKKRIDQLKDLRLHCFGHLHDSNGIYTDPSGKIFVNAAICTEEYKPIQSPRVITL